MVLLGTRNQPLALEQFAEIGVAAARQRIRTRQLGGDHRIGVVDGDVPALVCVALLVTVDAMVAQRGDDAVRLVLVQAFKKGGSAAGEEKQERQQDQGAAHQLRCVSVWMARPVSSATRTVICTCTP